MSVPYLGDFAEDATVYMPFNTFDSNDPSASVTITNLANGDIHVHKDGAVAQLATTGATVAIDFDGITGNHLVTIDTSASAEYSTGSDYHIRMEGTTVDGATVNSWIGHFSIQNRYSAGALRPTTAGRTLDVTATGAAGIDWGNVENQATAVDLSATDIQLADTTTTVTNDVGVNEWNGVSLGTTNPLPNAAAGAAGGLPTDSAGKTSFNDLSAAEVNTEVDNSMVTYGLDHMVSTSVSDTDIADNSIIAKFADSTAVTADYTNYDWTTDSLRALRDRGDAAWVTATTVDLNADQSGVTIGTVNALAAGSITAAVIATDAVDADALATDAVNEINATVDTALADIGLDHLISSALPTNWATDVASGSVFDNIADDGTAAFDRTTDSLQAVRDHVGDGTNLTEAGGTGDHLTAIDLPNQTMDITGNLSGSVGSVTAAVTIDAGSVDAIIDETLTAHVTADSVGVALKDILADTTSLNDTKVPQTLNLTASGNIGVDWANVENPTTAVDLSATDIQLVDTATTVTNQVSADVTAISGDTTAADRLEGLMDGTIVAQVNDASATTTDFAADGFTEATDDHFNGRLITFISGALSGQQTDITDYDAAGGVQGNQQFTVTALTEAPANNDFFVIH